MYWRALVQVQKQVTDLPNNGQYFYHTNKPRRYELHRVIAGGFAHAKETLCEMNAFGKMAFGSIT